MPLSVPVAIPVLELVSRIVMVVPLNVPARLTVVWLSEVIANPVMTVPLITRLNVPLSKPAIVLVNVPAYSGAELLVELCVVNVPAQFGPVSLSPVGLSGRTC